MKSKKISPMCFYIAAFLFGAFILVAGLYPHVMWSFESNKITWFHNSYDEGFYGWQSIMDFSWYRLLSGSFMQVLYLLSGYNTQVCMILADGFLPFGVFLAACFMVRPLVESPLGMIASGFFVVFSSELLALRSSNIPHHQLYKFFEENLTPFFGGTSGIWQIGNLTSTFWLFRTPEPQVSWIFMFLVLGIAIRAVACADDRVSLKIWLIIISVSFGIGYIFCTLPLSFGLFLFGILAFTKYRKKSIWIGLSGLLGMVSSFAFALFVSSKMNGDSLVFESRFPVLTFSCCIGIVGAIIALIRARSEREASPLLYLAIAFGVAPIIMANQQILTGRMIYLMNFENFGFAQLSAMSFLIAFKYDLEKSFTILNAKLSLFNLKKAILVLIIILFAFVLFDSQITSYKQHHDANREAYGYAKAIQGLDRRDSIILCDDLFAVDILPILLGYRPNFLLSRDTIFNQPIAPLSSPSFLPENGKWQRANLYFLLDLRGVTSGKLGSMIEELSSENSSKLDWRDRFLLGSFLYNGLDWWPTITHGRNTRLDFILKQKYLITDEYKEYLKNHEHSSVVFLTSVADESFFSLSGREFKKTRQYQRIACFEQEKNL